MVDRRKICPYFCIAVLSVLFVFWNALIILISAIG